MSEIYLKIHFAINKHVLTRSNKLVNNDKFSIFYFFSNFQEKFTTSFENCTFFETEINLRNTLYN